MSRSVTHTPADGRECDIGSFSGDVELRVEQIRLTMYIEVASR